MRKLDLESLYSESSSRTPFLYYGTKQSDWSLGELTLATTTTASCHHTQEGVPGTNLNWIVTADSLDSGEDIVRTLCDALEDLDIIVINDEGRLLGKIDSTRFRFE